MSACWSHRICPYLWLWETTVLQINTDFETSTWSHLPRTKSPKLHLQLRPENCWTRRGFKKRSETEHVGCLRSDPRGGGGGGAGALFLKLSWMNTAYDSITTEIKEAKEKERKCRTNTQTRKEVQEAFGETSRLQNLVFSLTVQYFLTFDFL